MTIKVNHVEIPVLNLKKAKEFFDSVFGYEMDIVSMPEYGLVDIQDGASIGFPVWEKIPEMGINVIFGVDDIDTTLKSIDKSGGKIHREKYLIDPYVGHAAEFIDCFGNRLGLFSAPN